MKKVSRRITPASLRANLFSLLPFPVDYTLPHGQDFRMASSGALEADLGGVRTAQRPPPMPPRVLTDSAVFLLGAGGARRAGRDGSEGEAKKVRRVWCTGVGMGCCAPPPVSLAFGLRCSCSPRMGRGRRGFPGE